MKFDSFEDIVAWQKAGKLTMEVYTMFRDSRDFAFKDQIKGGGDFNRNFQNALRFNQDFINFITLQTL